MEREQNSANNDQLMPQSSKRQFKFQNMASKFKTQTSSRKSQNINLSRKNVKNLMGTNFDNLNAEKQNQENQDNQNPQKQSKKQAHKKLRGRTIKNVVKFLQHALEKMDTQRQSLQPEQLQYLQSENFEQACKQQLLRWDHPIIKIFQIVFLILVTFGIWINTYQLVLDRLQNFLAFRIILIFCYVFSIILNFNSQMRTESWQIIGKRWDAVKIFMRQDFAFEIIPMLAIFIQIFEIQQLYYPERIFFLSTLPIYLKVMKKIEDNYSQSVEAERRNSIIKLVFRLLALLHHLSLLLNTSYGIQKTWVIKNNLEAQHKFSMYVNGYYWASTIVSSVGFGDISPGNIIQRGILSFIEISCCLFFGYCLNIIGHTIGLIGQSRERYQKQSRQLNKYLKKLECPNQMKNKLKQHFYNRYQIQRVHDAQVENNLFSKMTQQLKTELKQKSNINIIESSRYLKGFSLQTKKKFANLLQKRVYAPNQVIFDQETIDIKLQLISQGKAKQFCYENQKSRKAIAQYDKKDNTIGWSNLITGFKYNTCVRADNYLLVYEIDRNMIINTVKQNLEDEMKFNQIREKTLMENNNYKKNCFLCQKLTHNVVQCPSIHFNPRSLTDLLGQAKITKWFQNLRKSTYRRIQKFAFYVYIPQEIYEDFDQMQGSTGQTNKFDSTDSGLQILGLLFKNHTTKASGSPVKQIEIKTRKQWASNQKSSPNLVQQESPRQDIDQNVQQDKKPRSAELENPKGNLFSALQEIMNSQANKQKSKADQTSNISKSRIKTTTTIPQKSMIPAFISRRSKKRKSTATQCQQDWLQNQTLTKILHFNTNKSQSNQNKTQELQFDKVMLKNQTNFFADYHISAIIEVLAQNNINYIKQIAQSNNKRFSYFKSKFDQVKKNSLKRQSIGLSSPKMNSIHQKRLNNIPNRYRKTMICLVRKENQFPFNRQAFSKQ